jgi:hypothetical protein
MSVCPRVSCPSDQVAQRIAERTWSLVDSTDPLRDLHAEAKGTRKNPNAVGQALASDHVHSRCSLGRQVWTSTLQARMLDRGVVVFSHEESRHMVGFTRPDEPVYGI